MAHRLAPVVCLAFCTCGFAQTPPAAASQPASAQVKVGAQAHAAKPSPSHTAAKPSSPAAPTSLLDNPAQPAKVSLVAGELTVQADNSSLSEILHQIAAAGGMKVEGLQAGTSGGQRVFGSYGPGAPSEVLSELLNGSGYNIMMLGETSSGAPRELTLMARAGAAPPNAPQPPSIVQNEDNESPDQPVETPPEQNGQPEMPPGPGIGDGVRTPQQMLQNLQRMREQQEQEQQQQQEQQQEEQPDQQPDQPDQPDQPN